MVKVYSTPHDVQAPSILEDCLMYLHKVEDVDEYQIMKHIRHGMGTCLQDFCEVVTHVIAGRVDLRYVIGF